jgi:putative alpha-1,2-mannosidase
MIHALLDMYDQGGRIPLRISYRILYSSGMIGDHGSSIIIDSYMKGIRDFDTQKAYEGMIKNAFESDSNEKKMREGLNTYLKLGYVAADSTRESVSLTLEHTFVDWGLAQVAKAMGKTDDFNRLALRTKYYKNLYDPGIGFFRPRLADRNWLPLCGHGQIPEIITNKNHRYYSCFDPHWIGISPNRHLTESNAYQYLFNVTHDIPGMIRLMGGKNNYIDRLDDLFTTSSSNSGPWYIGVSGAIGQYVHGNEPSHHVPYLYNYAGAPWKTQERVREIMDTKYGFNYRGLPGNDDMGQMSAWYVFSALGFYPVTTGAPVYTIGSPLFKKAVISLDEYYQNKKFVVKAKNVSGNNKYIQSAKLNGKPLLKPWITHEEIVTGGILKLRMGPTPNKTWGNAL